MSLDVLGTLKSKVSGNGRNGDRVAPISDDEAKAMMMFETIMGQSVTSRHIEFIERGKELVFPEGMDCDDVASQTIRWAKGMNELVSFREKIITAIPTDAAIVLTELLREMYPMLTMTGDMTMMGYKPPPVISVTVADGESYDLYLGNLKLPGFSDDEKIRAHITYDGIILECEVRRKREKQIKQLIAKAQKVVTTSTVFRGKALRFRDVSWIEKKNFNIGSDTPEVFNLDNVDPRRLRLNPPEWEAVRAGIFGRIQNNDAFHNAGLSRGGNWIFSGEYGTGKSLCISNAMAFAVANGWTVIQFDKASQFNGAMEIALRMQSNNDTGVLMVIEDVELAMPANRKDEAMTELSNLIDGANKQFDRTMLIMTTNEVRSIHPLFKRRSEIIEFRAPEDVIRQELVAMFLGKFAHNGIDYQEVSNALVIPNNNDPVTFTPVFIEQACDGAKEQAIVDSHRQVTTEMLLHAISVATPQVLAVYRPGSFPDTTIDKLVLSAVNEAITSTSKDVSEIHEHLI